MTARSYDMSSRAYKGNPFPTLAAMNERGPCVRAKVPWIGSFRTVTTHEAVNEFLRDRQRFVRDGRSAGLKRGSALPRWMPRAFNLLTESMIERDEPDHRRLRGLVEQAFLRRSIERIRPRLEAKMNEMLDDLEAESQRRGRSVDLVSGLARPFPLLVICELLGLPPSEHPAFVKQVESFTKPVSTTQILLLFRTMNRVIAYLREQIRNCRSQPREGLISELIASEQKGDRLSEEEMVCMLILLLLAGHITTTHLISGGIHTLLAHPEQKEALLSDWSRAEAAIEEMLRFLSPVQLTRPMMPRTDMEWRGQRLKRGETITANLAAANADSRKFEHPERFDITRRPNPHVGFGVGIHACLGAKLAKVETEIALRRLFTRFPDLKVVSPPNEAKWSWGLGTRGMEVLPVTLTG